MTTGEYRGSAHQSCNAQYSWKDYKIPVIFHNLKGYDSHFLTKALNQEIKKIKLIPTTTEKFITFSLDNLEFIDSFSFRTTSLESLVSSLAGNKSDDDKKKMASKELMN